MFLHTTNRKKIDAFKNLALVAGALCIGIPASADTTISTTDTTTTTTAPMSMVPAEVVASADINPVDYSCLVNPILSPFDIKRAHAYGLTNKQIATVMAISDKSGWTPSLVLGMVEDGISMPEIAANAGIPPTALYNVEDYRVKLHNLEMAYATTGYARAKHMEKVAGWTGTMDNRWNGDMPMTQTTEMTTTTSTLSPAGAQNIVDTARAAGNFTTLIRLLQQTGLAATLTGTGPYTVFAPTDAAFAKIPTDQLNSLMANNNELTQVLEYHVIPGRISAADAMAMTTPTSPATLEGQPLTVVTSNGAVTINGANVTTADIQASNGVIHVIDTVLMPPASMATPAPAPTDNSVTATPAPAATDSSTMATPAPSPTTAPDAGAIATTPNAATVPMAPNGAAVPPPSPSTPASGTQASPGTTPVAPSPTTPGQSSQQ